MREKKQEKTDCSELPVIDWPPIRGNMDSVYCKLLHISSAPVVHLIRFLPDNAWLSTLKTFPDNLQREVVPQQSIPRLS